MAKQTFTVGQVLTAAQLTSLQQTAMGGGAASAKSASYTLVAADAGTTISMTSTSATTITVNTGLFAAGDTVFIQNLGSGNCTVTAGTATVSTAGSTILPTNDAGILYFVSTGVAIFYDFIQTGAVSPLTTKGDLYGFSTLDARIPIGANNTVLTADSTESLGLKWAAPAGASFVGCGVKKTSDQSINNSTATVISWDSEDFDTNTMHDNSTNNTRITVPSGKGGYYLLTGSIAFNSNSTGNRIVRFYKNGSDLRWVASIAAANTGNFTIVPFSQVFNLSAADYIELYAFQSSGGALSVMSDAQAGSHWQMQYLGA